MTWGQAPGHFLRKIKQGNSRGECYASDAVAFSTSSAVVTPSISL